jgi:hypothetical protein
MPGIVIKLLKSFVFAKDARMPGYRAAIEAVATASDDTHYVVPRDAYLEAAKKFPSARVALRPKTRRRLPRVAVGDLVERMLTGIGISKERVQQWLRVKDCGCAKRQKWLNQWGYKQQDRIERLLNRAARWYGIG